MIWLGAVLLVALAALGLALPWWLPRFMRPRGIERRAANVTLYRQRLELLPGEVRAGTISAEAAEELKAEMAARLLVDAEGPELSFPRTQEPGAASKRLPLAMGIALAVFAGAWYGFSESWHAQALIDLSKTNPEAARELAVGEMIAKLEAHLKEEPGDADSWIWLARTYRGRERFADAAHAFGQASALKDEKDPDVLTEQGEALAAAQDRDLRGAPAAKFQQALALAPEHPRALWFAGVAAVQSGDDRAAIEHWERLLLQQGVPDDLRTPLEQRVRELRERNHMPAPKPAATESAAETGVTLQVTATLAPQFAAQVHPGDTVFVYALDPSGPPMPLAVQRVSAAQLPKIEVNLSDRDSVMPTRKLSSVNRWRVVARISRSGNAIPQPGDLQGQVEVPAGQAAQPVQVLIDQQRP